MSSVSEQSFLSSEKNNQREFYWRSKLKSLELHKMYCHIVSIWTVLHLCKTEEEEDQEKTLKKIKCNSATLLCGLVSVVFCDGAALRHCCSVSGAMHLIPFLSLFDEQLPPHPHEIYLQTPHTLSVINVGKHHSVDIFSDKRSCHSILTLPSPCPLCWNVLNCWSISSFSALSCSTLRCDFIINPHPRNDVSFSTCLRWERWYSRRTLAFSIASFVPTKMNGTFPSWIWHP